MSGKRPTMRAVEQLSLAEEATPLRLGYPIRVVVADDERDTVMTLGILLRSEGFDVRLVQAGSEVPAVVAAVRPHAVLLDIGMPDRSGTEVANELKQVYGERCPLLIAVTARSSASDRAKAYASGFKHYVQKPYDAGELVRLLSGLVPGPRGS